MPNVGVLTNRQLNVGYHAHQSVKSRRYPFVSCKFFAKPFKLREGRTVPPQRYACLGSAFEPQRVRYARKFREHHFLVFKAALPGASLTIEAGNVGVIG